jgi:hypothetical protein
MLLLRCLANTAGEKSNQEIVAMKIKTNMKSGTTLWGS